MQGQGWLLQGRFYFKLHIGLLQICHLVVCKTTESVISASVIRNLLNS